MSELADVCRNCYLIEAVGPDGASKRDISVLKLRDRLEGLEPIAAAMSKECGATVLAADLANLINH